MGVHGTILTASSVCATAVTAQGQKCLLKVQNQTILLTNGKALGECRLTVVSLWKTPPILNLDQTQFSL
jgi:hypothetical protein